MDMEREQATIMIVDDTPENLELLAEMLQARGYHVLQFPSGSLALRAAQKNPPDLILLDIMMPGMNGFEVCHHLKADENLQDIPVIFISALDSTTDKVKAFENGGVDYVAKPFREDEVLARVGVQLKVVFLHRKLKRQNEHLEELVAERTRQLAIAHERLKELDQLKNDFLHMISHEIRTPANGVLGVSEMMLLSLQDSEEYPQFKEILRCSSDRLRNLIQDATMIANIKNFISSDEPSLPVSEFLDSARRTFPRIHFEMENPSVPESFFFQADHELLMKALGTVISLATFFSSQKDIRVRISAENNSLSFSIPLNNFPLTSQEAANFFTLESSTRSSSSAESLGLAPVVARQIFSFFGGKLEFHKGEKRTGSLEGSLHTFPLSLSEATVKPKKGE